jgi:chemotaxis protein MotB
MPMRPTLVLAAVLVAACGVDKDKYMAKELEAQQYMKKYQDESQKAADLEKKLGDTQARLTASQQQLGEQRQQLGQLSTAKAQLEQEKGELQQKSAQYEQLAASLKGQIAAGQIEISELRGRMTVKLKDKILFPSGSAALSRDGKAALDAVADAFRNLQDKNVIVAGYTDDVPVSKKGPWKDNWDLSTARAVSVVRYLQSKDVPPIMLGAAGFSEYRPVDSNEAPEGRSQNRRIEIALTAADYAPLTVDAPK